MAEEKVFQYKPEWDGPLSGPSFEKQTEDAINALHKRIDEEVVTLEPYDGRPFGPTPAGSAGILEAYARGDHQHPEQAFVENARSLDHSVSMTLTLISADSSAGTYVERGVIGSAATNFGGASFNMNVDIPDAKAPSGGSGGVDGLMTAADKERLEAMTPYPRISAIAVAPTTEPVAGISSSTILPNSAMVELRIEGALGIKADVSQTEGAVAVSIGTDAMQIAGRGLSVSEGVIGIDEDYLASTESAGFMSPEMVSNLDKAFIGVSAGEGLLSFSSVDGSVTDVEVATSGGGGGGGGGGDEDEEAPQVVAVDDVSISYSYIPDAPARYTQNGTQSIELRRHGANFMGADTVLRNGVPFSLDFTTNEFTLHVEAQPGSKADAESAFVPVSGISSAELFGNGLIVLGETISVLDEPAVFDDVSLNVTYETPDEDHVNGSTVQYGTFTLEWVKTSEGTPDTYSLSITWHAPESGGADEPVDPDNPPEPAPIPCMKLTRIEINSTQISLPEGGVELASGTPLVEAFNAPDQDAGAVALLADAIPESVTGALSAMVYTSGTSGEPPVPVYSRPQITPGSIAVGGTSSMECGLYITYEAAEEGGSQTYEWTSAFGMFGVTWTRVSDYDFSVSVTWNAPEGTAPSEPEAALTVVQHMTTAAVKTTEVYMPDVASAIAATSANTEAVEAQSGQIDGLQGSVGAVSARLVANQALSASGTVIPECGTTPVYLAITPTSNVSGTRSYSAATSAYSAAILAYPASGTEEEQDEAITVIQEALNLVPNTQSVALDAQWGDDGALGIGIGSAENAGVFYGNQFNENDSTFTVFAVVAPSSALVRSATLNGIPPVVSGEAPIFPNTDVPLAAWASISSVSPHCQIDIPVASLPSSAGQTSSWVLSGNPDGSTLTITIGHEDPEDDESEGVPPVRYPVTLEWTPDPTSSLITPARNAAIVTLVTTFADGTTATTTADMTEALSSVYGITPAPVAP